jgi:hypothetical protein
MFFLEFYEKIYIHVFMGCAEKKLLSCLFILASHVGGGYLLGAKQVAGPPVDIYAATPYSPESYPGVDLGLPRELCQRVVDKWEKFGTPRVLVVKNGTSGVFYTFVGGFIPLGNPLLDEIDPLKVLGCSNLRHRFVRLLENSADIRRAKIKPILDAFKKYLEAVNAYIRFWEERFDGISRQNIQRLREQFQAAQDGLFNGTQRIHARDLLDLLNAIANLQLGLQGNPPFNHLSELFDPELLFLYVMEENIMINGFHFATFIEHNPLYIGLYRDMRLHCEVQLSWFTNRTDRAGKQLIVASVSPSEHPTRLPDSQFLRYNFLPSFIKIAFQEEGPKR